MFDIVIWERFLRRFFGYEKYASHNINSHFRNLAPDPPSLQGRTESSLTVRFSPLSGGKPEYFYKTTAWQGAMENQKSYKCDADNSECVADNLKPGSAYNISMLICWAPSSGDEVCSFDSTFITAWTNPASMSVTLNQYTH